VGFAIAILTVLLLAVVVAVVSAPLRRARRSAAFARGADAPAPASEAAKQGGEESGGRRLDPRDELEAAREAKYREIRDAELDFRTGKLSPEDYQAIDVELRAEAIEILNRLEQLRPRDA
jgi:hypothetical protein